MHWPVQMVPVHGRMELDDLLGQKVLENGSTPYQYGALSIAVKEGHILILDEMDVADPAELAGLYDLLDGAPLVLAQNGGEIIPVHPRFRFVATGNSTGAGDGSGLYQGVLRQSLAWLDRFRCIEVDYPDDATELRILEQLVPGLPVVVREKMVQLANEVRRLFTGSTDGNGEGEAQLSVTLSTRGLVRWARLSLRFQGAPRGCLNTLLSKLLQPEWNRRNGRRFTGLQPMSLGSCGQEVTNHERPHHGYPDSGSDVGDCFGLFHLVRRSSPETGGSGAGQRWAAAV